MVLLDELVELDRVGRRRSRRSRRGPCCSARRTRRPGSKHVGDAAAHARGEVAAGRPEDDHAAAGHVLAAVVADALDDRARARVADAEALAGEPAEERAAGGRAVEHGVADDDVLLGRERRAPRAGGRRARRPRGPCRSSRWRRRRATARRRARARRRTTGPRSRRARSGPSRAAGPPRRGPWRPSARAARRPCGCTLRILERCP